MLLVAAGFFFYGSHTAPAPEATATGRTQKPRTAGSRASARSLASQEAGAGVHPTEAATHGSAAFRKGDYQSALALFEQAIAARPDDAESLNHAALTLERLGRSKDALPLFERAIAINPGKWSYRFNLGHVRATIGDWTGAVAAYREADRLFPDDHVTLFNLGVALQNTGADAEAVEPLSRAAAIDPDDSSFLLALGNSYQRLGRTDDLKTTLRRFLELAPDAPEAGRVRAALEGDGQVASVPQSAPAAQTAPGL